MKVFISWSGDLSKQVAELLRTWIADVLQGVEPWVSAEDIEKGSIWFGDIAKGLAETAVGVLCLTRDNVSAPWVLFEAGGLAKGLSQNRVCPLLINLSHTGLAPPLSMFNGTLASRLGEWLNRALARLTRRQRTVVEAVWLDGQPRRDVARHLGISEGALRYHECKAMKRLRDQPLDGRGR